METVDQKTWAGRFTLLSPWFLDIISSVRRDCKNEHLRLDPGFVRQHFGGMPVQRISLDEMRSVYLQQILAGHERLAEFIANRWLFRNMDIYKFFEETLQKISPNFEQISELTPEQSSQIIQEACQRFSCEKVFCFVAINDVVLPKADFERLQREALDALASRRKDEPSDEDEEVELRMRAEMERLKERHEKKVTELTKKHQQEIQRLQREIDQLKNECEKAKALNAKSRA